MTSWPTGSVALLLKRQKLGPPTLQASAPFLWAAELLGPFAPEPLLGGGGRYSYAEPRDPSGQDLTSSSGDPPVGDSLQGTAVAASQPQRTVSEDVGAVGDAQDQQISPRCLQ